MNNKIFPLNSLAIGESAVIDNMNINGAQRRRMLDLGFVKGSCVKAVQTSPCGDPTAYMIRGTVIALRNEDADKIMIHF